MKLARSWSMAGPVIRFRAGIHSEKTESQPKDPEFTLLPGQSSCKSLHVARQLPIIRVFQAFCSRTPAYHGSGELSGERSSGGIGLTKVLVSCDPMSHGYISMEIRLLKHNLDWPASQKQTEPTLSKQLLARPVTYRPPALRQYDLIGQICQVGDIRYPLRPSTRQSARRSGHIDPQVSVHP